MPSCFSQSRPSPAAAPPVRRSSASGPLRSRSPEGPFPSLASRIATLTLQNRPFRNFFEKISAKPFASSKPRRTFALAKRDKASGRPARRRSLRDLHNRNCREVQEDRAVLLHRKECSGIQPLVNSTIDQDRKPWAINRENKDSYITMKSLILAQDER